MRQLHSVLGVAVLTAAAWAGAAAQLTGSVDAPSATSANATIVVDAKAQGTPFPHFWEQMFGSGRANLAMRQSYRDDLRSREEGYGFQLRALPRDSRR